MRRGGREFRRRRDSHRHNVLRRGRGQSQRADGKSHENGSIHDYLLGIRAPAEVGGRKAQAGVILAHGPMAPRFHAGLKRQDIKSVSSRTACRSENFAHRLDGRRG
jgi:hypothetical protein